MLVQIIDNTGNEEQSQKESKSSKNKLQNSNDNKIKNQQNIQFDKESVSSPSIHEEINAMSLKKDLEKNDSNEFKSKEYYVPQNQIIKNQENAISNNDNENISDNEKSDSVCDSNDITTSINKKLAAVVIPEKINSNRISTQSNKQSINKNINEIINNSNNENYQSSNYIDPNQYYVKFLQENRKGFESLKDKNYLTGKKNYETCYNLSKEHLNDKVKQIDSLINMSVCDFYNGNYEESVKDLETADQIFKTINIQEDNIMPRMYAHLGLKLYSNYCMSNMAFNKTKEAVGNIRKIEGIVRSEPEPKKEISYLKSVIYTLFRVNSLVNCDSLEIGDFNNNNKIIIHIMEGFQQFLKTENYESLCTCFREAMNKYKEINDNNGYFFSFFYYYVSLYHMGKLSENEIKEIKKKISICNKTIISADLINEVKEKDFDCVMREFKEKADASIEIFKILTNLENECMQKLIDNKSENELSRSKLLDKSHIFTNEKISSPIFVKLLIKYSLNFLNEEKDVNDITRTLTNELNILLNKINNDEIDISKIKLKFLEPKLINSLKQLFDNLIYIYYKHKLRRGFQKFKKGFLIENANQNDIKIKDFLETNYQKIQNGDKLKKINYSSNGVKIHYYKIENNCFQQRDKNTDKTASKSYNLKNMVIKVMYGFSSQNIKKKIVSKDNDSEFNKLINSPWKFISIIIKERTIDLYCEDNQINNWFYGLKNYFNNNNMPYKIISVNQFVLTKMKFKIVNKLRTSFQNDKLKENDNESKQIIKELGKEKGIQNISFCKILLLYNKLIND